MYPYESMDSFERFSEDKLPDKKHFYKSLKNKHISENVYLHAIQIWNNFKIKNMGDYDDLLCKNWCVVISWCFWKIHQQINRVLQTRSILLFQSQLSWIKLGYNVRNDWKKLSRISKRFIEANNKYMKNYDPTKASKYTIHLDANNSYTWVMNLAYGEFKWVKNVDNSDVN